MNAQSQSTTTGHLIYNVTVKVDASIADSWLQWMLQQHAPQMLATGCFYHYHVVKLLEVDETEGPTYAIQYFAAGMDHYNRYIDVYATKLRAEGINKWGNGFIAFRTLMEVVQ